jgi:Carboxypeptidase regulatory-like domain
MYLKCRKLFSTAVLLVSIALLQPYAMQAQQTLGGITGTVVDPSGSSVPGAEVKATSEDTKLERTAQSNAQGSYAFNDLPIGKYTVTFTKDG